MTDEKEHLFDELMAKLEEQEQEEPVNNELKSEIIEFLNDTLIKDNTKECEKNTF